jgi:WD40 repeat protein
MSNSIIEKLEQMDVEQRDYLLLNLPYHMSGCHYWSRVCHLLNDFDFQHQKAARFGVDSISSDLHTVLLSKNRPSGNEWDEKLKQLDILASALDLESHHLRGWDPVTQPTFFLQQLFNRLFEMDSRDLCEQITQRLFAKELPFLRRRFSSSMKQSVLLRTLYGHSAYVLGVAITRDGRQIISGSADKTIRIWDLESGTLFKTLYGHTDWVSDVAIISEGLFISASEDYLLKIWDLENGMNIATLAGHLEEVYEVSVTSDGSRAVSCSEDGSIIVWNLQNGVALQTLKEHHSSVLAIALTPDGQKAISGSADKTIKIWDLNTGEVLMTCKGHEARVTAIGVSPDARWFVSISDDRTIRVWDLDNGIMTKCLKEGGWDRLTPTAIVIKDKKIIVGYQDGTIKIWDLEGERILHELREHTGRIWRIALSPDKRYAVTASEDSTLKIWNLEGALAIQKQYERTHPLISLAIDQNGTQIVSADDSGIVKFWDFAEGRVLRSLMVWDPDIEWRPNIKFETIAVTPDGKLAFYNFDGLRVWGFESTSVARNLERSSYHKALAITPNGRWSVSAAGWYLIVWDVMKGEAVQTLRGHQGEIHAAAITNDGRTVVSASDDSTLKVWDLDHRKLIMTLEGHTAWVSAVAIGPDQKKVISGSFDCSIKIWDLTSNKKPTTLQGHTQRINALVFTPSGRHAVSVSSDQTLRVWDLEKGIEFIRMGASASLTRCDISPDGSTIVVGDEAGAMHIFDMVWP